jgi:NADH dehydrogenase
MILVAGSTGVLGGEICRRLVEHGEPLRAMARESSDPDKVGRLHALGVETVVGDLREPESLVRACRGVATVVSGVTAILPRLPEDSVAGVDDAGQRQLIDAARAAGVRSFVYVSYSGNIGDDCPLSQAKRRVEQHLRESGLVYTILRPSYFMETWLSPAVGFDIAGGNVRVYGSGEAPVSWISVADVAEFAAECARAPVAENAILELGGPAALSPHRVIEIVEKAGQPLTVEHVAIEALEQQKAAATNATEESFAELMLSLARGDAIPMEQTLETFPAHLTPVDEYVERMLSTTPAPVHT